MGSDGERTNAPSRVSGAGPSVKAVPDGDNKPRLVCPDCGYIEYDNPKIIVGAVCTWQDRVLLCRRAIAPRIGLWTIPAGYMELNETLADGTAREVFEEAGAQVHIGRLIGLYEIPHISQVYVIYHAPMVSAECAPGEESQEVHLFRWEGIPWDELAFPSVTWALQRFRKGGVPDIQTAQRR